MSQDTTTANRTPSHLELSNTLPCKVCHVVPATQKRHPITEGGQVHCGTAKTPVLFWKEMVNAGCARQLYAPANQPHPHPPTIPFSLLSQTCT